MLGKCASASDQQLHPPHQDDDDDGDQEAIHTQRPTIERSLVCLLPHPQQYQKTTKEIQGLDLRFYFIFPSLSPK